MQFFSSKKVMPTIKSSDTVAIKSLPRGECIVELNSANQDAVIFNQKDQRFLPSGIHKFDNESFEFILFISDFSLETQWHSRLIGADKIYTVGGNITIILDNKESLARNILLEYRESGQVLNYPHCINHIVQHFSDVVCQEVNQEEFRPEIHMQHLPDYLFTRMSKLLLEEAGLNLVLIDAEIVEAIDKGAEYAEANEDFDVEQLNSLPIKAEIIEPKNKRPAFSTVKEYFYINANGERVGLVSEDEIQKLIDNNEIFPATRVWKKENGRWDSVINLGKFYFKDEN